MRLWPGAVRWRLTLWYSLTLAVMLGAFAVGSLAVLRDVLVSRTDDFLEQARDAFVGELVVELREMGAPVPAIGAAMSDVRFRDVRILVYDAALRLVAVSDTIPAARAPTLDEKQPLDLARVRRRLAAAGFARPGATRPGLVTVPDDAGGFQVAVAPVRLGAEPYLVAAVHPGHPLHETIAGVRAAYLVAIPLFLGLAALGGYWLARRALAPVAAMGRHARAIGATNLHERLPGADRRDELGELASVVNDLLGRLEGAFEQQHRFVADASHELRTPVAIVRAESEIALSRTGRPEGEYRDALRVLQEAGERLSRVVDDLFTLARADSGHLPVRRAPLYLDELAAETAHTMRSLAALRSVRLDLVLASEAAYDGDPELLGRLLRNLLDNAIKYARPHTAVRVELADVGGAYRLAVSDAGEGIPPAAQPHVFDRFYRAERARSRAAATVTSGAGLGLAIARWIAEAHGGRLDLVRSDARGTEFALTLPAPPLGGDARAPNGGVARAAALLHSGDPS